MPERTVSPYRSERVLAACRVGSLDQLQEAVDEGNTDLNVTDSVGNTPLILSVKAGSLECVDFLLKKDSLDLDLANTLEGNSSLHVAISSIRQIGLLESIIQALLEAGANPKVVNKEGLTPLEMLTHRDSSYEKVAKLLKNAIAALNLGLEQQDEDSDDEGASSD